MTCPIISSLLFSKSQFFYNHCPIATKLIQTGYSTRRRLYTYIINYFPSGTAYCPAHFIKFVLHFNANKFANVHKYSTVIRTTQMTIRLLAYHKFNQCGKKNLL
jgi:hypothetical protein